VRPMARVVILFVGIITLGRLLIGDGGSEGESVSKYEFWPVVGKLEGVSIVGDGDLVGELYLESGKFSSSAKEGNWNAGIERI